MISSAWPHFSNDAIQSINFVSLDWSERFLLLNLIGNIPLNTIERNSFCVLPKTQVKLSRTVAGVQLNFIEFRINRVAAFFYAAIRRGAKAISSICSGSR